jgi:hypothetical protein
LRHLGITEKRLRVRALRVIRYSQTGHSILCEVCEYCSEPVEVCVPDFGPIEGLPDSEIDDPVALNEDT